MRRRAKLLARADKRRIIGRVTHRKRYRLQRAAARIMSRIRAIRHDIHNRIVNFLLANFDTIILPAFNTKDMAVRVRPDGKRRVLGKQQVDHMQLLGHYEFKRVRLLACLRVHVLRSSIACVPCVVCMSCSMCVDVGAEGDRLGWQDGGHY
jgi:putative transposase